MSAEGVDDGEDERVKIEVGHRQAEGAGIIRISIANKKACNTQRIGVVGVFSPRDRVAADSDRRPGGPLRRGPPARSDPARSGDKDLRVRAIPRKGVTGEPCPALPS